MMDRLYEVIANIAIYTVLTVMLFDWLLNIVDVELNKTGKIIVVCVVAVGYTAVTFVSGRFPLPGL